MKNPDRIPQPSVTTPTRKFVQTAVTSFAVLGLMLASLSNAHAAAITKAATGTDLNAGASWTGAAAPTDADVATWDSTSLGAGLTMAARTNWQGVSVSSALTAISITGAGPLGLGSGGFDLSASAVNMTLANSVILTANQTWNVNAGRILTVGRITNSPFNLTKSGAGTNALGALGASTIGGTLDVTAGVFQIGINDFNCGGLTGSGTVENGSATTRWIFPGNTNNQTFSGTLQNGALAGRLGLNKSGAGKLTLSGTKNLTDQISIRGGILELTGPALAGGPGGIRVVLNDATSLKSILTIATDVTATNIFIGDRTNAAGSFAGGVYQTSGNVRLTQTASVDDFRLGSVANGQGYYKLSGGTLSANEMGIGGSLNDTTGVMDITGGTVTNNGYLAIARGGQTCSGVLTVSGGTFLYGVTLGTGPLDLGFGTTAGATAVLNVGGDVGAANVTGVSSTTGTTTFAGKGLNLASANVAGTLSVVNLITNGTLTVSDVTAVNANPSTYLNFNGGTLKATTPNNLGANFMTSANIDGVYVYGGGATIDNNGTVITCSRQLLAPTGSGVATIPVTDGGSGYVGAPLVKITDGTGASATAIANMVDDGLGNGTYKISSITVTIPGDYSAVPTIVTLKGGSPATNAILGALTTVANTSGGATFTGSGTTTLSGGTTYTGPTAVRAGTLVLSPSLASYAASALTVSNATLSLDVSGGTTQLPASTVTVQSNTVLNIAYGTLSGIPIAAINATGALTATGTNVINITGSGLGVGQFPLIAYTGAAVPTNNFRLGSLPAGIVAVLTNNASVPSLDLLITGAGQLLTWNAQDLAATPFTTWDINTSSNWNGGNAKYLQYAGNTYGDNVTFNDALLNLAGTNVTLNATLVPASVTFNSSMPYSITGSGRIAGVTGLNVTNTGSVFLGSSNTYTGGTIVGGGSLVITNDSALGTNSGTVSLAGGNLQLNGVTSSRAIGVTANSSMGVTAAGTSQLNGIVSGSSALTKIDNGTLNLSGANTFSGLTAVKAGTLQVSGGNYGFSNANIEISPGAADAGTLTVSGGSVLADRVIISGISANTGTFGPAVLNQSNGTINSREWFSVGSGANGGSTGSGTFNLSGGVLNVHSQQMEVGNFTATDGTVNMSGSSAINIWNNNFISFGANNNANSGTFNQNGGTVTLYSDAGVTPGGTGIFYIGRAGTLTGGFTNNLNGGTLVVPQVQGNTANAATRVFNFNGGTLRASKNNTTFMFGLTAANVLTGGAVIDSSSNNITISQALLSAGAGGLTKQGTGILILTGTNNYSGPTIVSSGTLLVQPGHQAPNSVSLSSGATFGVVLPGPLDAVTNAGLSLAAGTTTLSFALGTNGNPTAPPLYLTGSFNNAGTFSVALSGSSSALSLGAFPLVRYGGGSTIGAFNSAISGPAGMSITLSNGVGSSTLYAVITSLTPGLVWDGRNIDPAKTNVWGLNAITNWTLLGSPTIYTETVPPGDAVRFTDSGTGLVILSNTASPASMIISNVAVNYTFQGSGHVSGTMSLTKTGTGSATMSYAGNDYTGATLISNGMFTATSGSAIGDLSAVTLANVAGASLVVSAAETIGSLAGGGATGGNVDNSTQLIVGMNNSSTTYGGAVSGTGRFIVNGTGSLTVTGSVAAGNELWVGAVIATNTPTLNIQSGATATATSWFVVGRDGSTGTVNINGGTMVHDGAGNITLGTLGTTPRGILNLNSGTISNATGETYLGEGSSAVNFGDYNQAGGTALLGNLYVGRGASAGQGIGTATVTGGTLTAGNIEVGYGFNNTRVGTNTMAIGAGAVVNATGYVRVGYAGSATMFGSLTNNGGTLNVGTNALFIGYWDPCNGTVTHTAGAINLRNNAEIQFGAQAINSGICTFDQTGGNVTFYSDNGVTVGGTGSLNLGNAGSGTYTYNLNGGILTVPSVRKVGATGTGTLNLNGGTLRAAASSGTYLQGLSAANVMVGGVTVDTVANDIVVAQALLDGDALGGGLTKTGTGKLTLTGAGTYTGLTTVSNGTLQMDGSIPGAVTVKSGATLGGNGTIGGVVTVEAGGKLAAGASIGALTVNSSPVLGGTVVVEIDRNGGSPLADLVTVVGNPITYGGTLVVSNIGAALQVGDVFTNFIATGHSGSFSSIVDAGTPLGAGLAYSFANGILTVVSSGPSTTRPQLTNSVSGSTLNLSWAADHLGFVLETQTNARSVGLRPATNFWLDIPGSTSMTSTNFPVSKDQTNVFFRLRYHVP